MTDVVQEVLDRINKRVWEIAIEHKMPFIECIKCYAHAYQTGWDPPAGYDQGLKRYVCAAGHFTYHIPGSR